MVNGETVSTLVCFFKPKPAIHSPEVFVSHQSTSPTEKMKLLCKKKQEKKKSATMAIKMFPLPVERATNSLRLLVVWKGITFPWQTTVRHLLHSSLRQQPLLRTVFLFPAFIMPTDKDVCWLNFNVKSFKLDLFKMDD